MTFVPQYKILTPYFPAPGSTDHMRVLGAWLFHRDGVCWVGDSDCSNIATASHHAIFRKSDVQGWQPKERRCLIDNPYCCIRLCTAHHETALEPSRVQVADWMYAYYRQDFVRWLCWLRDTQFKVFPAALRGWLERHNG